MKFCEDCKFMMKMADICSHPETCEVFGSFSPVRRGNRIIARLCYVERHDNSGNCGPDAKLFEEREK